jgi:hypothetical protein
MRRIRPGGSDDALATPLTVLAPDELRSALRRRLQAQLAAPTG